MHVKLARLLEQPVGRAVLITGPSVLVDRAARAVDERLGPMCAPASFNRVRWRAGDGDGAAALSAARTPPMMAERRVVRVDGVQDAPDAWLDQLLGYLASPSDTTTLLVSGTALPRTVKGGRAWATVVPKAFAAAGSVLTFGDEDADPARFVIDEVRRLGGNIAPSEARMVVDLVGAELAWLEREAEKLTLAVEPGATIDAATVASTCAAVAEPVVWDLTSAIAARRVGPALASLRRLLADGEAPHRLLALILWQMRLVLRMADMVRQGVPDPEIRSALRMRGDLFGSLRRELDKGGGPAAAVTLSNIARANRAMNRARAGDARVLEDLVLRLATR